MDRGIAGFNRIGFLKRSGKAFLATPLGRFEVVERSGTDLLCEVDPWLDRFRAACSKSAPPRFGAAFRRIESAIFKFCKNGGVPLFQEILVALGAAERVLAGSKRSTEERKLRPLAGLSFGWLAAVDDQSPEFILARALSSIRDAEGKIGPLRANLEPIDWQARSSNWVAKDRAVVWNAAALPANLAGVFARRLMDGARAGCAHPPLAAHVTVPLGAITRFINGDTDDARIEDLIWGLMLLTDDGSQHIANQRAPDLPIPTAYALLKLLFLPRPMVMERSRDGVPRARLIRDKEPGGIVIYPEPSIPTLLRGDRLGEACMIAMRRLRASGLSPRPGPIRGRSVRDRDWRELDSMGSAAIDPQRLAAALLIPIADDAVNTLVRLIIHTDDFVNDSTDAAAGANFAGETLA